MEEGAQGLRDAGGGDGYVHSVLAAVLHLVSDHHNMRGGVLLSARAGVSSLLDW